MTREEAIKCLTVELGLRSSGYYDYLAHGGKQDKAEEESLDSLHMALSALREQPRWISVEERLPERKGKYLIFAVGSYFGYAIEIAYWTPKYDGLDLDLEGRAIWYDYDSKYGDFELDGVRYWMHLPGVPKKEEV